MPQKRGTSLSLPYERGPSNYHRYGETFDYHMGDPLITTDVGGNPFDYHMREPPNYHRYGKTPLITTKEREGPSLQERSHFYLLLISALFEH